MATKDFVFCPSPNYPNFVSAHISFIDFHQSLIVPAVIEI